MYIQTLKRHLAVCGIEEVQPILNRDRDFWNIISIRSPNTCPPVFRHHKAIHHATFYDIENPYATEAQGLRTARFDDLIGIMELAEELDEQPLLIHCHAGVSRSTATCLVLIIKGHINAGQSDCVDVAVDQLLSIRPRAVPNCLVLCLGLATFMAADDAAHMVEAVSNHPRLIENRFINPLRR